MFLFQIFFFTISSRWPRVSGFFACIPEYRFRERRGCIIYMIVTIHPHNRVFILQCKFSGYAKWNKFNRRPFHYVSNWENLYIFRARLMNRLYNCVCVYISDGENCLSLIRTMLNRLSAVLASIRCKRDFSLSNIPARSLLKFANVAASRLREIAKRLSPSCARFSTRNKVACLRGEGGGGKLASNKLGQNMYAHTGESTELPVAGDWEEYEGEEKGEEERRLFRVSGIRTCIARRSSTGATTLNINKLNLLDYKPGTPGRRRRRRHRCRRSRRRRCHDAEMRTKKLLQRQSALKGPRTVGWLELRSRASLQARGFVYFPDALYVSQSGWD